MAVGRCKRRHFHSLYKGCSRRTLCIGNGKKNFLPQRRRSEQRQHFFHFSKSQMLALQIAAGFAKTWTITQISGSPDGGKQLDSKSDVDKSRINSSRSPGNYTAKGAQKWGRRCNRCAVRRFVSPACRRPPSPAGPCGISTITSSALFELLKEVSSGDRLVTKDEKYTHSHTHSIGLSR